MLLNNCFAFWHFYRFHTYLAFNCVKFDHAMIPDFVFTPISLSQIHPAVFPHAAEQIIAWPTCIPRGSCLKITHRAMIPWLKCGNVGMWESGMNPRLGASVDTNSGIIAWFSRNECGTSDRCGKGFTALRRRHTHRALDCLWLLLV